jgi:tRNA(adenine34) deaminase
MGERFMHGSIRTGIGPDKLDLKFMQHCIDLSKAAAREGEFPFACVIVRDGDIIAEAANHVIRDGDVTRHAELVAVSLAQRALGGKKLYGCTLYSNVEPCVMCSFPIREARISRVVFSLKSPYMGGFSRWNVLGDETMSQKMRETFGSVPEVLEGVLAHEVARSWRAWNPIIWRVIKGRGCFVVEDDHRTHPAAPRRSARVWTFFSDLRVKLADRLMA